MKSESKFDLYACLLQVASRHFDAISFVVVTMEIGTVMTLSYLLAS
jgi:hypothetical protein